MDTALRMAAVVIGLLGLFIYYQSIVRVMLLNRPQRNIVERGARFAAVATIRSLAFSSGRDYEHVQCMQAWVLPLFIFFAVTTWFLLVQFSFSFILWGLRLEANWPIAFSSSGSALSTLGYKTPPTLLGEYLAIFEAAIGLAIVILLFTFVPGYQAAIQTRERKVGWLYARTGRHPTCVSLLESLKGSNRLDDPSVWEDWETWFRGVHETHSIVPILAYMPSIYSGTTWVGASAAVLDATSLLMAALDPKRTEAERICRETGASTLRLIATALHRNVPVESRAVHLDANMIAAFDQFYEKLIEFGLPVVADKETCRNKFVILRAEYEPSIQYIAKSTLMPIEEPWVLRHAHARSVTTPH